MKQLPYTVVQLTAFTLLLDNAYAIIRNRFGKRKIDLDTHQQIGVSLSCGVLAGVMSSIASHPGGE